MKPHALAAVLMIVCASCTAGEVTEEVVSADPAGDPAGDPADDDISDDADAEDTGEEGLDGFGEVEPAALAGDLLKPGCTAIGSLGGHTVWLHFTRPPAPRRQTPQARQAWTRTWSPG